MDTLDRLNLNKMIDANNVQDCTNEIREKKHSDLIRQDVSRLVSLKKKIQSFSSIQSSSI